MTWGAASALFVLAKCSVYNEIKVDKGDLDYSLAMKVLLVHASTSKTSVAFP